jgi:hypothetical protein
MKLNQELPIWMRAFLPITVGCLFILVAFWADAKGASEGPDRVYLSLGVLSLCVGVGGLLYSGWKMKTDPEYRRLATMTDSEYRGEEERIMKEADRLLTQAKVVQTDSNKKCDPE